MVALAAIATSAGSGIEICSGTRRTTRANLFVLLGVSSGVGKSEVLEVIDNALNEFYRNGESVKIAGKSCKGAIEEAETTGQSAKRSPTVFVLYEKMPGQE
jgi:predicted ATP-binding protein involved in virulence